MTEFIEIFNPGARYLRQQKDLEKSLIVEADYGGDGPQPLDLDSGVVSIVMRRSSPHDPAPRTTGQRSAKNKAAE